MKTHPVLHFPSRRVFACAATLIPALLLRPGGLWAANTTWTGSTDTTWATAGNWTGGAPDTSSTWDLTFSGATQTTSTNNVGGTTGTVTLSSLTFANTNSTVFTLNNSGSRTITLIDGATVSTASGGTGKDSINVPLTLSGSATLNTAGQDISVGAISGGTIVKTGASALWFTTNFANNILFNAGTIDMSATGASGTVTCNGGASFIAASSSGLPITFSFLQGVAVRSFSGNITTFTSPTFNVASSATSNVMVTLSTASGSSPNEIQGTIQNNLSGKTVALTINSSGSRWKLSGSNSYSGGTTVSAGTLLLGSATALGASTGAVSVTSGAVLDLNGIAMSNTNALTINGTGVSGSGALINSSTTAATYTGLVKLGSASSIMAAGGNITLSNTGTIIGSGFGLTVGGAYNTTIAGIIGTGAGTLIKQDAGILTLSGSNTYSGATAVNGGILNFQNTSAKSASTSVTVGASASLGLGVGGAGYFSSTDVDNLFANTLAGVTMNATSGVGIDTSAGDFTYATSQSAARALAKFGANKLILTGSNSYVGTTISQGVLQIGNGGVSGALGAGAVTNNGNLTFNRTDDYGGAFGNTIAGTGGLTLTGGTLTLSGSNNYTGGNTISAGTLKMGSSWALGGSNSTVTVASGAVLDVAGITGTASNPYALTISGSGISGGGSLTNSGTTWATSFGAVTLGSDSTIKTTGAGITLGSSTSPLGISGSYALTVDGNNQLDVFGGIQTASVVKIGTGSLRLESANPFAGGLWIKSGQAIAKNVNALGGNGSGTVYLGDTVGSNNTELSFGAGTVTFANPIIVQAGNSGGVTIDNFANNNPTLSGGITLNKGATLNSGNQSLTVSGAISGTGGLTIASSNAANPVILSGSNSFTGNTTMSSTAPATLQVANVFALQNSTLDTGAVGSQSVTFTASGTNTYNLGGLQGSNGLSVGANTINVGANGASTTYSGVISGSGELSKSGAGLLTLSGSNSYTGPTSIQSGTLALGAGGATGSIGASSVVSFANNAVLGFNRSNAAVQGVDFPSSLSGAGGLAQLGSGTLTLNAANTYSAGTVLAAGRLNIAAASSATSSAIGTGMLTINGGTIDNTSGADVTLQTNNPQAWNGSFTYAGSANNLDLGTGAVVLGGTNSFPSLTVSSGTLAVGGAITGYGYGLYKYGNGTLALNGSNNITGTFVLFAGSVQLGNSNALTQNVQISGTANNCLTFASGIGTVAMGSLFGGVATQSIALTDNGGNPVTLSLGSSNYSWTLPVALTGAGGLTKVGAGTLTLAASNTFTGKTLVSSGTLMVGNNNALCDSALDTSGAGVVGFTVTAPAIGGLVGGGNLAAITGTGYSSVTTLTLSPAAGVSATYSGVIANSSTSASLNLTVSGSGSQVLTGSSTYTGNTTISGGRLALATGQIYTTNAWNNKTITVSNGGTVVVGGWSDADAATLGGLGQVGFAAGNLVLNGGTLSYVANSTNGGNFDRGFTIGASGAALDAEGGIAWNLTQGRGYGAASAGGGLLTLTGSGNGAISLSLPGVGGLAKSGAGLWSVSGSNSYSGATTVNAGILQAASANALGNSGTIAFTGGTLQYTAASAGQDWSARFKNSTASIALDTNGQTISLAGALDSTNVAGLVKTGAGTLILSGSNSYSGATVVNAGTLAVSGLNSSGGAVVNAGGVLALSGSNGYSGGTVANAGGVVSIQSTGALPGWNTAGQWTINSGGALTAGNAIADGDIATLLATGSNFRAGAAIGFDTTAGDRTFASSLTDTAQGALGLVKIGLNTLILSGSNNYSGGTTVSGGTLAIAGANALGSTAGAPLMVNGGALDMGATSQTFGSVTIAGGAIQNGTLSGTSYSGQAGVVSASLAGAAALNKSGTGTLTLTGSNSYSGGTVVNAGVLAIASTDALPGWNAPGQLTVISGGVLVVGNAVVNGDFAALIATGSNFRAGAFAGFDTSAGNRTYSSSLGNTAQGALGFVKAGDNTLVLSGSSTYTGATTVYAGMLQAANASALGSGGNIVFAGGTLQYASASAGQDWAVRFKNSIGPVALDTNGQNITLAGAIDSSNAGGLVKSGSGSLTLSGSNTYSGGTTIDGGILKLGSAAATGGSNASIFVAAGGTLDTNGLSGTSAIRYNLTLNGAGDSAATGALVNSSSAANASVYFNSIALGSDSTISTGAKALTIDSGTGGITGNHLLTVNSSNEVDITGSIQTASVSKNGAGSLLLWSANSFSGGLQINAGSVIARYAQSLGGNGTGTVYLGNAVLNLGAGGWFYNPIVIQSGSAIIDNYTNWTPVLAGTMTLNSGVTLRNASSTGSVFMVGGVITGTGGLTILNSGAATSPIVLSGSNTFSGVTTMSSSKPSTLQLGNVFALQNSTLDVGTSGSQSVVFTVSGTNTYYLGGLKGADDLAIGANTIDVGANGASTSYSGAISGAGGLTKSGTGTLTLSGSNSYGGATIHGGGTLQVGNANALGTGGLTVNGGTLDLNANSVSVAALGGAGGSVTNSGTAASTLTTAVAGGTSSYAGNIANGAGSVAITKSGSGTLILSGSLSMAGLNANGGVTQLTQSGSIGAVSVASGATLSMTANSGGARTVLDISSLTISGFASGLATEDGASYACVDSASLGENYAVLTETGNAVALAAASSNTLSASPEAVPEPGALGMLLAGASALLGFRRRAKRSVR